MPEPFDPPRPPPAWRSGASAEHGARGQEPEMEDRGDAAGGQELLPGPRADLRSEPVTAGPLREIAHAFRMNAEALQTIKQMQLDLTTSVQRGDRSELVLQSTRALNETFRNLSSVQRELLTRLDRGRGGGGRGPLIPLMLLGLLGVLVAATYVILGEVQSSAQRAPAVDPALIVQRERDSYKEGRQEAAAQADRELRRMQEALEAAQGRSRKLEQDLDAKLEKLSATDRERRLMELERDEFAGQVRRAQNEIVAKQVLEEDVTSLRSQIAIASREVTDLRIDLDRQRRQNGFYRQRLADYGMDIPQDDPPYRPPAAATDAEPSEAFAAQDPDRPNFINLLVPGARGAREARGAPPVDPAASARPQAPEGLEAPKAPGLPPPVLRKRAPVSTEGAEVQRVRARLNELLDASPRTGGETWQVTRIDGIARDRLQGVILLRYDGAGRLLDGVEARDLRIHVERERRQVVFLAQDGVRVARDQREPLPAEGLRFVVVDGDSANAWADSGLTMVKTR